MKKAVKPAVIPTLVSSKVPVWSAVLVAAFLAVLAFYSYTRRAMLARDAWRAPVSTKVDGGVFRVDMPAGWQAYSLDGTRLRMFRRVGESEPMILVKAVRAPENRYRAVDTSAALLLRKVRAELIAEFGDGDAEGVVADNGLEVVNVRPGISGVHFVFSTERRHGEGLDFFYGDCEYLILTAVDRTRTAECRELADYVANHFDNFDFPDFREEIDRPVINSDRLTAEESRTILDQVTREFALWKMFESRADNDAMSLLTAIGHFRHAATLLSRVRQEKGLLSEDHYRRYEELLAKRRAMVAEWFVLLEKYRAVGDRARAKEQARYIGEHATLKGEAADARRALDVLDEIGREEAAAAAAAK